MPSISDKVQTALDEGRILVLGTEVLLGFEFRSFFEPRFEAVPEWAKSAKLVAACVMLLAFALITLPASYHRLVADGEDRPDVHRFTTSVIGIALLPLGVGLGLDVAFSLLRVLGPARAVAAGGLVAAGALGTWYAFTYARRAGRTAVREEAEMRETELSQKIRHVLTETRMVLPGAQALLGFQLAVTLTEPFDALPRSAQYLHVAALAFIAAAIVLLMTPAAYHRIVERGEDTERFHRIASRLVLSGMVAVALGLCADLHVVARKVLRSEGGAAAVTVVALASILGAWFGLTLALRARQRRVPRREARAAARS